MGARLALGMVSLLAAVACGGQRGGADAGRGRPREGPPHPAPAAVCPARAAAPLLLPGVEPGERTLAYWLARTSDLDTVLLSAAQIDAHDRTLAEPRWEGKPLAWADLLAPVDVSALARDLTERLDAMRGRIESGEYVDATGLRLDERAAAPFAVPDPLPAVEPELRVALGDVQVRCGPRREGLYKLPVDPTFNRNNCSNVAAQEPLRVLMRWPSGPRFVRTRHAFGWIDDDAALSDPVPTRLAAAVAARPRIELRARATLRSPDGASTEVPAGTVLPAVPGAPERVLFATAAGVHESTALPPALRRTTTRDLTRRAVLEAAFARLDTPYGWGGERGGLDCSGLVLTVFASFGMELPRDSGRQALAGTDVVPVEPGLPESERLALLDAAARRGIVLLHFPGHIMLYLGRNEHGTPMAIHAFAEYLEPCAGGGETLRTVDRVTVSDLSLGRGTSRTSFLERITRIVVLGPAP